jgi:hypothetical protein
MTETPQETGNSGPDTVFNADELVYRRYARGDYLEGGFRPQSIHPVNGTSVNRAKYSNPEDALHPNCCDDKEYVGLGIYSFSAGSVEDESFSIPNDKREFRFEMRHVPLPKCKAHSQIHCIEKVAGEVEPPQLVRQLFRIHLWRNHAIVMEASG